MNAIRWWIALCVIAAGNIAVWVYAAATGKPGVLESQLVLSGIYVFGCAYRSAFPVYDIPRICMVDSWASTVLVGRSVATLAELAFAAQWAVYLHRSELPFAQGVSLAILPMIVVAEICSWHAVLTTSNRGHVYENSLWGFAAALIVISLGAIGWQGNVLTAVWAAGGALYVAYIFIVDVPTYRARWKADQAAGRRYLTLAQGLVDVGERRVVSRRWEDWRGETVWMTLYFSFGVWASLSLVFENRSQ